MGTFGCPFSFPTILLPMRRFLLIFVGLQLLLFGIELTQPVQQHLCCPAGTSDWAS